MEKEVFVIMPFSDTKSCTEAQWTEIFEEVFKPAFKEIDYSCERAKPETGSLIKSIITKLHNSFIVLADITDRNANVFYELGVRHSLSKRTIIVTQDANHIPSDLKGYWSIVYSTTPSGVKKFKHDIKELVTNIEKNPLVSDSPVSDFLDNELFGLSKQTLKTTLKKLMALKTELTGNINTLTIVITNKSYKELIDHLCLDLYTSNLYIDFGEDFMKLICEYRTKLRLIKSKIDVEDKLIRETIGDGQEILKYINNITTKISKGEYEEPLKISSVQWILEESEASLYSSIVTNVNFDLKDI
jgi:hypothetical protein